MEETTKAPTTYTNYVSNTAAIDQKSTALDALRYLSETGKKEVTVAYLNQLAPSTQREVTQEVGVREDPGVRTINFIWRIIVSTFALALLASVASLIFNTFVQKSPAEALLTIFTTVVAFLAGLLTPSPLQSMEQNRRVTDYIWMIVVVSFVIILLGSSIALTDVVFLSSSLSNGPLITLFTTSVAFLAGFLAPGPLQNMERSRTDKSLANWEDSSSAISVRIGDGASTAQNLNVIISALAELHTKCWLIQEGRFADLSEYTKTGDSSFEVPLLMGRMSHNSPMFIQVRTSVLSPSGMAVMGKLIDGVVEAPLRYSEKEIEVDSRRTDYTIKEISKKLESDDNYCDLLNREEAAINLLPTLYKLNRGNGFERLAPTEKSDTIESGEKG